MKFERSGLLAMHIEVQTEIAASDHPSLRNVATTMQLGWHEWAGPDPSHQSLADFFSRESPATKELFEKSFKQALAYGSGRRVTVTKAATGRDQFENLLDASMYLLQPLDVFVENERTDGKFYRHVLALISPALNSAFASPRPPLEFRQAGGKAEAALLVVDRCNQAVSSNRVPPRMLVIADSDAQFAGHVDQDSSSLKRACDAVGAPLHLTAKRSLENYLLAADILYRYQALHPTVCEATGLIMALSREQCDFYPVKSGLSHFAIGQRQGEVLELYRDSELPLCQKHSLARIAAFVLADLETLVTREVLEETSAIGEIEDLVLLIESEL